MTLETVLGWLVQSFVSFIASAAFSVLFHIPKKHILPAGLTGGFGWLIYLVFTYYGFSAVAASFFATIGLGLLSRLFAIHRHAPVTIFLITGIFPLVPGIGIYRTGYSLFMQEFSQTTQYGLQTIEIAVVMALGIGLVLSLPRFLFTWKRAGKPGNG